MQIIHTISELREVIELAGFQETQAGDLTEILSTDKFTKAMLRSGDGASDLTQFGKYHYHQFQSAPIYFGEIKARKPAAPATTISAIGSSHKDSPVIPNLSTTLISSQSTDGITSSAASNLVYALGTIGTDLQLM